ncbi:unnamed protein product [Urochloa humidicola]
MERAAVASAAAAPHAPPFAAETTTSRYEKLEAIGAGAFGVVYRKLDRLTGEIQALNCLNAGDDLIDARRLCWRYAQEPIGLDPLNGLEGLRLLMGLHGGSPLAVKGLHHLLVPYC